MDPLLIAQDAQLLMPGPPDDAGVMTAAVVRVVAALESAVVAAWPGAAWAWMHGPDTLPRAVAALARRVAGHVPDPEGGDGSYYAPLGGLIAAAGGHRLVWRVDVHAAWRGRWGVAIEPRLRRTLLWILDSDRIPGRHELPEATAIELDRVVRTLCALPGCEATTVPSNPHRQRTAILVFP